MHLRGLDLSDLTLDLSLVLEYVLATVNQEETFSLKYEANWFSVGKEKIFTRKKAIQLELTLLTCQLVTYQIASVKWLNDDSCFFIAE